jgi:hypothetical protein
MLSWMPTCSLCGAAASLSTHTTHGRYGDTPHVVWQVQARRASGAARVPRQPLPDTLPELEPDHRIGNALDDRMHGRLHPAGLDARSLGCGGVPHADRRRSAVDRGECGWHRYRSDHPDYCYKQQSAEIIPFALRGWPYRSLCHACPIRQCYKRCPALPGSGHCRVALLQHALAPNGSLLGYNKGQQKGHEKEHLPRPRRTRRVGWRGR